MDASPNLAVDSPGAIRRPYWQRLAFRWLSFVVIVGSCIGLGLAVAGSLERLPPISFTSSIAVAYLLSGLLYAAFVFGTAFAWRLLLRASGHNMGFGASLAMICVSHIGRYLPGSVGMYVSRIALARRYGISPGAAGAALVPETAWAISSGIIVVLASGLAFGTKALDPDIGRFSLALCPLMIAFPFVMKPLLRKMGAYYPCLRTMLVGLDGVNLRTAIYCLFAYSYNVCVVGLSLAVVIAALSLDTAFRPLLGIFAFSIAWLAGLIALPAPAGIGVREAALLGVLGPVIGVGPALAAALIHRVLTLIADAGIFGAGMLLLWSQRDDRGE